VNHSLIKRQKFDFGELLNVCSGLQQDNIDRMVVDAKIPAQKLLLPHGILLVIDNVLAKTPGHVTFREYGF
jgi:hypothetical protein